MEKSNSEKLAEMLEFDPTKKSNVTKEILSELVKEIQEERVKEAKTKGKEQLLKAIQLQEQMHKAKKDFENQYNKMEKELGKILNQIQGAINGKPPDEEPAN